MKTAMQDSKKNPLKFAQESLLFLRQFIRHPFVVGAIIPSSNKLANYIAEQVPLSGTGCIIELGAGTGAITTALIKQGLSRDKLYVIEKSPELVLHLRETFPEVKIIEGDAKKLGDLVQEIPCEQIDAIVSSLPLRSLPDSEVKIIIEQIENVLSQHGKLVQFTYDLRKRAILSSDQLLLHSAQIIWSNLPPACVYVYSKN